MAVKETGAMDDPQFKMRGIFERKIAGPCGAEMVALPTPFAQGFLANEIATPTAPRIDEHGGDLAAAPGDKSWSSD